MAKIEDIPKMTLSELRPLVQRAMKLEEWPVSDWIVVGMIFDQTNIHVDRASFPPQIFQVIVSSKVSGHGLGTGIDADPVVAIFRAYLIWRSYQAILEKKTDNPTIE